MAGTFTQRNRDLLAAELGREPTSADLYVAHFLGARGAVDLIRQAQTAPRRSAAAEFPDAAAANRPIFFDRKGRARGAGEVYALLAASHGTQAAASAAAAAARFRRHIIRSPPGRKSATTTRPNGTMTIRSERKP